MKTIARFLCILCVISTITSCKQKGPLDKSIYEDMTAEEILGVSDTIPSFRYFYDNIRSRIVSSSDEYDKVEHGEVTYESMYDMFRYWESPELQEFISSYIFSYSEKMTQYQFKVDSVSDYYRTYIDRFKVLGVPCFDYTKIFEHPEPCYIGCANFPYSQTDINFILPIKNRDLFDEIGIEKLDFVVTLTDKSNPGQVVYKSHGYYVGKCCETFTMRLYDGNVWSSHDPKHDHAAKYSFARIYPQYLSLHLDEIGVFMNVYDAKKSPRDNFLNAFDWYYEVVSGPDYNKFIKSKLPENVYRYWMCQEDSNISNYIAARNKMIWEYCDGQFEPLSVCLPMAVDENISTLYPDEFELYQKVQMCSDVDTKEFESMFNKDEYEVGDWVSPYIELPMHHPNGNYIRAAESVFDKRIPRDPSIIFADEPDENQRRPGESYASYIERIARSGAGLK